MTQNSLLAHAREENFEFKKLPRLHLSKIMTLAEGIDLVIYINLDKRTDRRVEMETELKRVGIPEEKILRWSAVFQERGTIGCTLSHVGALNHVKDLPQECQTILILEDDFNFAEDLSLVNESLTKFLKYPRDLWDVALLSYHVIHRDNHDDLTSLALYSHGTAGYLVNRQGLLRLLAVLEESRDGLLRTGEEQYVIDVYWHHFMQGRKCLYFNIPLGYQRESYSDIQHKVMLNLSHVG